LIAVTFLLSLFVPLALGGALRLLRASKWAIVAACAVVYLATVVITYWDIITDDWVKFFRDEFLSGAYHIAYFSMLWTACVPIGHWCVGRVRNWKGP
jgi:hypothetical protein